MRNGSERCSDRPVHRASFSGVVMVKISTPQIVKADVDRFLAYKHVAGCPVCGRDRRDVGICTVNSEATGSTRNSIDTVLSVCESCGAAQFYSHAVIVRWLERQRRPWGPEAGIDKVCPQAVTRSPIRHWNSSPVAALAALFLLFLISSLLLHRYGATEVWTRPTIAAPVIATMESGSRAITGFYP